MLEYSALAGRDGLPAIRPDDMNTPAR